jgi:phage baseplate assembly protein W
MVDYVKPNSKNVAIKNAYKDLDLSFTAHPITGDVATKSDSDAVRRAVRNIVMTNYYERPFKPSLGGNIRGLLFELDTDRKLNRAKKRLTQAIEDFEPRVQNVRCVFQTKDNSLDVTVFYNIKNGLSNQELQFTVNRTR